MTAWGGETGEVSKNPEFEITCGIVCRCELLMQF